MVKSSNDSQGKTYDLTEFAIAQDIVTSFPRIIKVYKKLLPVLYENARYHGVWITIQAVEDALTLMEMQLRQAQKTFNEKGLIDESRQTKK